MISGFRDFEFDLPSALLTNLVIILDTMAEAELNLDNLAAVPEAQGVYQLLLNGEAVYVGKTDAEAGLKQRLTRHAFTVQHRLNLDPAAVSFKAIRIYVFTAMDLETQLINHYKPSWNNSGFGSNDPGRERDITNLRPNGFDANYPVNIDHPIIITELKERINATSVIRKLQSLLPYTLRAEAAAPKSRKLHPDFDSTNVLLPIQPWNTTARSVLELVLSAMPFGWQATLLPGRIVIYKEARDYKFGDVITTSQQKQMP